MIAVNWGTYIWGVNNHRVVETSLGYFINPLVTVLMGVLILRERLRRVAVGGPWHRVRRRPRPDVEYGHPPWVALTLAFSFGTYGLAKKQAGVEAVESLTFETLVLAPVALGYLVWLGGSGDGHFVGHGGRAHAPAAVDRHRHRRAAALLRRRGHPGADDHARAAAVPRPDPAVPPRRDVLDEHMTPMRWVGFALVWVALVVFTLEAGQYRRQQTKLAVEAAAV